jgi:hypothetical protein
MGRKTLLTPEKVEKARELRAKGLSDQAIYTALGICRDTFYTWIRKGEAGQKPYTDFAEAIKKGEAELEEICVSGILEQGLKGNWQALAWLLERLFPERYAKKDRFEVTQQKPFEVVVKLVNSNRD